MTADSTQTLAPALLSSWVAYDPASVLVLQRLEQLAESTATVLVRGESGVGKAFAADLLHGASPNANEPVIFFDCASVAPELVEIELFGFEQGGYARRGRLEIAGAGTLVLKEVAALSMPTQAMLLRSIEQNVLERRGSNATVPLKARIVALTAADLERAVTRRTFREDLYYRLNVSSLLVPPLRERRGDIGLLVRHFVQQMAEIHRRPLMTVSSTAMAALEAYAFPGNVRELRNMIERAVLNATPPEILLQDLPPHLREADRSSAAKISLEELERHYIAEVLEHTRGKKTQAARILGISRKTLLEKRKRYGFE